LLAVQPSGISGQLPRRPTNEESSVNHVGHARAKLSVAEQPLLLGGFSPDPRAIIGLSTPKRCRRNSSIDTQFVETSASAAYTPFYKNSSEIPTVSHLTSTHNSVVGRLSVQSATQLPTRHQVGSNGLRTLAQRSSKFVARDAGQSNRGSTDFDGIPIANVCNPAFQNFGEHKETDLRP
jgi:hypothetical protein